MELVAVSVAYARSAQDQRIVQVSVPHGTTVEGAILASGLLETCPEIDLARQRVGVFGGCVPLTRPVEQGDRVEIYRALIADPKEARRRRARRRLGV